MVAQNSAAASGESAVSIVAANTNLHNSRRDRQGWRQLQAATAVREDPQPLSRNSFRIAAVADGLSWITNAPALGT